MAERIALRVDEGGQRVDRFLAARSLLSRSAIARLAKEGRVLVDGTAVEPAYKVRVGQELIVDVPEPEPVLSLAAENIPIDVLYEDEDVIVDPGVADKRLLLLETEFSAVLKQFGRDKNILSNIVRQAWDGKHVFRSLVKQSPVRATGAHISLIGHATPEDLRA